MDRSRVGAQAFRLTVVVGTTRTPARRRVVRNAVFLKPPRQRIHVKSTRKGLREGELEKDNYERLLCADCGTSLAKENPPEEVYSVRSCPDCGREWKELR